MPRGAGSLDRRIRFEQATLGTPSSSGAVALSWNLLAAVWASVEPLSGREAMQAQQLAAKVDTRFTVRWSETLSAVTPTETYRIVYEERAHDITHAAEIGRRENIEFLAAARAE